MDVCEKITVPDKIRLEIDPPIWIDQLYSGSEQWESKVRDWVKEFNEFIRDHRSQDDVVIEVIQDEKIVCSKCKESWEPTTNDWGDDEYSGLGDEVCFCCGGLIARKKDKKVG